VAELFAALLLAAALLTPTCHRPADPDRLLAASKRQGAVGRPLNYPPSDQQETNHG
jgi:hypothetical protein